MNDSIIPWLFGLTFLAFLVWGVFQWRAARRAKRHHEHSAMPPPTEAQREAVKAPRS
jgi:hypothetical protein